jgi:hypothetical protein
MLFTAVCERRIGEELEVILLGKLHRLNVSGDHHDR